MPRTMPPATEADLVRVDEAIAALRQARDLFVLAKCPAAATAVRHALKSAGGARRHVERRVLRTPSAEAARYRVLAQRYVEEVAEIPIDTDDPDTARDQVAAELANDATRGDWRPGDEIGGPEVYAVLDADGATVWER